MESFDLIVVGRGLMGTAAARWLAEAGHRVALVGPDEPAVRQTFEGPFASHHDAARITRQVAHDPVWAGLARASIARYRDLEARSGIPFFQETGALIAGRQATPKLRVFTDAVCASAGEVGAEVLTAPEVAARFPYRLPEDSAASFEARLGGWVDPRAMRRAEEVLAEAAGAVTFREAATGLAEGEVTLAGGTRLSGGEILWATGGYATTAGLLPARPRMEVCARTVAFAEVAGPIAGLPPLIWVPVGKEGGEDLYLLPPVRYPDGRWLLKVGGETDSPVLTDDAGMTEWFHGAGRAEAGEMLLGELRKVLPAVPWLGTHTAPCVISFTATGYPYIERIAPGLTLLTGGNGAAAKSCDEIGRIGAEVALGGSAPGFEAVLD